MITSSTDSSAEQQNAEEITLWLGYRKGQVRQDEVLLRLTSEPPIEPPSVRLQENETVSFILRHADLVALPTLEIQDLRVELSSTNANLPLTSNTEYVWSSDKGFFVNHFGWSILTLELQSRQGLQKLYASVEVFATKINAERAGKMLHYLEQKMDDITRSCFTATSQRGGNNGTTQTLLVILQEIERQLASLRQLLPTFQRRKHTRLVPKTVVTRMEDTAHITDTSVVWVLAHLDHLVLSPNPSPSSVFLKNRYYDTEEIESNFLYEDTDVYENQIIAGYLESLSSRIGEINGRAQELEQKSGRADYISVPVGFASFSKLQKEYEQKFCAKIKKTCEILDETCREYVAFFKHYLPVNRMLPEMPKTTPGFLSSPHYQQLFRQIVAWYQVGNLTISGEQYLYGLRTLDKLYEFFCLFRIIEALEQIGWKLNTTISGYVRPSLLVWDTQPASQYEFSRIGGGHLTLYYDQILFSKYNEQVSLFVTMRENNQLRPDFLVEISHQNESIFIVLDAKYSTYYTVWSIYVQELTMKYIHGIGSGRGGHSPIQALLLMYPRTTQASFDQYNSFHREQTLLSSRKPVLPIIGSIEVSPDQPEDVGYEQPFLLSRVLEKALAIIKPSIF